MKVHFINVGYGEAVLIVKDNFLILVDGGTDNPDEYVAPGCIRADEYIEKSGFSKIDLLVITHLHDDHISGLVNVIKKFQVKKVWVNVMPDVDINSITERLFPVVSENKSGMLFINALKSYTEILNECRIKNITIEQICKKNGKVQLEKDISIEIISPALSVQNKILDLFRELSEEKDIKKAEKLFYQLDALGNKSSMAFRVKSGEIAVLLTGDQTEGWEEAYREYGNSLRSQILKVSHHGQIDGMPRAMLDISCPDYIVICSSSDKRFNSAHPSVIESACEYLCHNHKKGDVFITYKDGTIILPPAAPYK